MAALLVYPLDGTVSPHLTPDLEEKEIYAIGYIVTQWSMLEHEVLVETAKLLPDAGDEEVAKEATSFAFSRRLKAWKMAIDKYAKDDAEKKRLISLHGTVAQIEDDRHKVAHGLWDWDETDPTKIKAHSFRPRADFEKKYDFDALIALGTRVGQTTFKMRYPGGRKQSDEALAKRLSERGYMSRAFIKMLKEAPAAVEKEESAEGKE